MRLMRAEEIPAYIGDMLDAGCDIVLIGGDICIFLDQMSAEEHKVSIAKFEAIVKRYGQQSHLHSEIASHLAAIGRRREF